MSNKNKMNNEKPLKGADYYIGLLKKMFIIFIILTVTSGFLNMFLAKRVPTEIGHFFHEFYFIFENYGRSLAVIISAYLTVKIVKAQKKEIPC